MPTTTTESTTTHKSTTTTDNNNSPQLLVTSDHLIAVVSAPVVATVLLTCGFISIRGTLKDTMSYRGKIYMLSQHKPQTNYSSSLKHLTISVKSRALILSPHQPPSRSQLPLITDYSASFRPLISNMSSMVLVTMPLVLTIVELIVSGHPLVVSLRIRSIC